MNRMQFLGAALALLMSSAGLVAAEVEVVAEGLYNPCGIAVQPETGHLFVADSGNLKVVRIVDGKPQDVVVDFGTDIYGKGPKYQVGPLGIAFLDKNTLVVGGGGFPDGEEKLYVFTVPEAGQPAIKASEATSAMSLAPGDEIKGEGNFYALAVTDNAVYVTCNGDDTKGWVSKAVRDGNKLTSYERYLATKEAVEVDAPVGITVSPDGHLVVGQMGEITVPEDGLVTFYRPDDGKMLANFPIGLSDITGLAYSPGGQLYAIDFCWNDTTKGGLFQLIRDEEDATVATAKKVSELDKPTAMAFGSDGNLYVTLVGTGEGEETSGAGKVVKISGLK